MRSKASTSPELPADNDASRRDKAWFSGLQRTVDLARLVIALREILRECALPQRLGDTRPTVMDVLKMQDKELSRKSQGFAKSVAAHKEEFESHFRDNRKRAIAAAWEIAHAVEPENDRITYEFACACLRAHRTRTAFKNFEVLSDYDLQRSKYVASARRRVARHAWKAGNPETAMRVIRSVRGRSARTQYRTWLGISTIRNGLLIAEGGDVANARSVVFSGLVTTGIEAEIAGAVANIYLQAFSSGSKSSKNEQRVPGQVSALADGNVPVPVVLSGFGWSGSGAVADFLLGHPEVNSAFSGREMGFWTGKYGLDRLYIHFVSRGFNRRLLLEFLTRHCFGHKYLGNSKGTKSLGGMWAWLDEDQKWLLIAGLDEWLEAINHWKEDPDFPLLDAFQKFSSRFLGITCDKGTRYVLLSNCITSDTIAGIRMYERPVVITSWRNPGDAYASKLAAFPDNSLKLAGWQNQLEARIQNYLAGKREVVRYAQHWMDISFEEFVQNSELRDELLRTLGLDGPIPKSSFDASASEKNIGIFEPAGGSNRAGWADLARNVEQSRNESASIRFCEGSGNVA